MRSGGVPMVEQTTPSSWVVQIDADQTLSGAVLHLSGGIGKYGSSAEFVGS